MLLTVDQLTRTKACPRDKSGALLIPQIKGNADLYAQGSKTFVILAGLHGVHPTYQALKVASHATGSIYPMDSKNDGLAVLTMPARVDVEFEGESPQEVLALALTMAPWHEVFLDKARCPRVRHMPEAELQNCR